MIFGLAIGLSGAIFIATFYRTNHYMLKKSNNFAIVTTVQSPGDKWLAEPFSRDMLSYKLFGSCFLNHVSQCDTFSLVSKRAAYTSCRRRIEDCIEEIDRQPVDWDDEREERYFRVNRKV